MKTMKFKRAMLLLTLLVMTLSAVTGGTIAWFTDSVESANNIIEAGNLDIEVYVNEVKAENKVGTKEIFDKPDLWEPGAVATAKLILKNEGNLALKYQMTVSANAENDLNGKKLSDVLKIAFVKDLAADATREQTIAAAQAANPTAFAAFKQEGSLAVGATGEAAGTLVVYWLPGANDNDYNVNNGKQTSDGEPLFIKLGLNVEATQDTVEVDGFGTSDYDEDATFAVESWDGTGADEENNKPQQDPKDENVYVINTAAELAAFAAEVNAGTNNYAGKTVKLNSDINLNNNPWTPIGPNADKDNKFKGTFDGQGHTIYNLYVKQGAAYHAAGFFGALNGTVKNLTIDGAYVESISTGAATDNGTAVVAGSLYRSGTVDNVHVKNATVIGNRYVGGVTGYTYGNVKNSSVENVSLTATPDKQSGSYDNGDKVGGISGYYSTESVYVFENNTATNVTIKGYRDLGGIIGTGHQVDNIKNNKVIGATITADQATGYYGQKDINANAIVGRLTSSNGIDASNTSTNVKIYKTVTVTSDAQLEAAIKNAVPGSKLILEAGDYAVRFTNNTSFNVDGLTITGKDGAKLSISSSEAWYGRVQGNNVTFENIIFPGTTGTTGKATYNNCTFEGRLECASSKAETYVNGCTLNEIHTSGDMSAGNIYVKNSTITKAEYGQPNGECKVYFENCTIGELISWNVATELKNCTVKVDNSQMTSNEIIIVK